MVNFLFYFIIIFKDSILYIPGWPGTTFIAKDDLAFLILLPPPLSVSGLQVCVAIPRFAVQGSNSSCVLNKHHTRQLRPQPCAVIVQHKYGLKLLSSEIVFII